MSNLYGGQSRVGEFVQGLLMTSFAIAFVVAGCRSVYSTAHQAATWGMCTAIVTKVTGGDEESDELKVAYGYAVDGCEYSGELRADEKDKTGFAMLKRYEVGHALSVRYDPAEPARSQLSVAPTATGFAFIPFVVPFLLAGLNSLWFGLSGREFAASSRPTAESSSAPGRGLFWVFLLICTAGTVAQVVLSICLDWPLWLYTGLVILFVFIPGVSWFSISRTRSSKGRRGMATTWQVGAPRPRPTRMAPRKAKWGRSKLGSHARPRRGLFRKPAITTAVTLFWCGITGVFVGIVVYSCVMCIYAQQHFLPADGVILSSKIDADSDSDGSSYKPVIKYRYRVGGKDYISDRYAYGTISNSSPGYASAAVKANPNGAAATVYYDPDNPSESVLCTKIPSIMYFRILFLLPFVLVGIVLIRWTITLPWK